MRRPTGDVDELASTNDDALGGELSEGVVLTVLPVQCSVVWPLIHAMIAS